MFPHRHDKRVCDETQNIFFYNYSQNYFLISIFTAIFNFFTNHNHDSFLYSLFPCKTYAIMPSYR